MPTYLSPGVYVEEVAGGSRPIEGVGSSVAAFVGLAPTGPLNEAVLVRNWAQFVGTFGDFSADAYLAHAVYGFFANGGGVAYVVRVGDTIGEAESGSHRARAVAAPGRPRALPDSAYAALGTFRVAAADGVSAEGLTVEVGDPTGDGPEERFTLTVKQGDNAAETFDVSARRNARNYVVSTVKQRSKLVVVEEAAPASQLARPQNQAVAVPAAPEQPAAVAVPQRKRLEPTQFLGDTDERTGLGSLEALDEISIVAAPDLMAAYERGVIDLDGVKSVQLGMIAHCESLGDRMAILDPPPGYGAQAIRRWRQDEAGYDSTHAALYYPWIQVFDPSTGRQRLVPPSGHMAGIWARSDAERGVHKAPANEVVRGAVDLELQISRGEQDLLNPIGVNCIRAFPGRGVRVWGARTISSDPAWRYLNVRRYFNYLEESILLGTQWVVFEPNDQALWARIRRNVSAFLVNEWRAGALFGATPEQAFYVKCDAETNPAESVDAGRVVCEIGIAPVKPAEFVVFRLAQYSEGGGELTE
ncbi:phage tail sheath subtilisin-like domain-containing protein [Cryptosporangium arvum]|uniref:phage tail sheath subtilisin-like domain-containing protein n=1 Tax=Cryptosporangium arvum TaxID=80871 RepID=UPI0004B66FF1|nr:phage tail sheath subtilisin-like domain-containing protein [Cryptosporangium arvum]